MRSTQKSRQTPMGPRAALTVVSLGRSALATGRLMRRRDQVLADADQVSADCDQAGSISDQASSAAGWRASREAQECSDLDQQASDADQAAADRHDLLAEDLTSEALASSAQTRAARASVTALRVAASVDRAAGDEIRADQDRSRAQVAVDRDACSDERDVVSQLRDQACAAAEQNVPVSDATHVDLYESARLRMVGAATRTLAAEQRRTAAAARARELMDAATEALEYSRELDAADSDLPTTAHVPSRTSAILQHLPSAAARGELSLHYQPLFALASGELVGFEALLRWTSPELGAVTPNEFIPLAEASGLIVAIGDWVTEEALTTLAQWRAIQPERGLTMSINIAPEQLTVPGFVGALANRLDGLRIPPAALTLEVTERTLVADTAALHSAMEDLRRIGVQMSVDDFGTGFSSLGRLASLPLDEVKIDRIFVASLTVDRRQRALVAGILAMSTALGLRVVAEGIETDDQRHALNELGCELGQGYLLGRPSDAATAEALVADCARQTAAAS